MGFTAHTFVIRIAVNLWKRKMKNRKLRKQNVAIENRGKRMKQKSERRWRNQSDLRVMWRYQKMRRTGCGHGTH